MDRELTLFNLQRPEVIASPWSYYTRLRTEAPVYFDPYLNSWLLSRYADVANVLGDARFSVEMHHEARLGQLAPTEGSLRRAMRYLDGHVSFVDPPRHTRIRATLAPPFQPSRVRTLEALVAEAVTETLDRLSCVGEPDLVRDLAAPVPLRVIQKVLGLSGVELATLRRWSTAWGDVVGTPGHLPTGNRKALMVSVDELVDHLHGITSPQGRDDRRGTVTEMLVQSHEEGELSQTELISNLMMLVTAGNETTTNLISNCVLALIDDDSLWERLRADRSLLPAAIEELARVYPPTQYTARTALENVDIGGHVIQRGQAVVLILAAANRDPDMFDDPDVVRIDRPNARRQLAFGRGIHFCFGAPLARLETRLVLDGLLDGTQPRPAGPGRWRLNSTLRGLDSLPVQWNKEMQVTSEREYV
jgi:cytochrome P450